MVSRTCEDPYYGSLEYQHKAIRGQDKEIYSPNASMLGERRTPPSTRFQHHHQHRRSAPRHHHHPQPMRRPLSHQQRQLSSRSYYDEPQQQPQERQSGPSLYPQMHPPHHQHREWRSLHASFSHAQSLYYEGDDASFYGHDDDYQQNYSSSERHRDGRWSQQSQQYNEEDEAAWAVAEEEAAREREYREQQETQQRLWKLQQQEEEQLRRYKEEHEARKAAEAEQERQKEQARQQERLQKEEEKRAHQNKIAELVRPAGIPKPPPPPPDLHLSQTQSANPHWATTNTTPVAGSPSPTMSNKSSLLAGEKEITIPKESDHCSEISRVSWDPPYPFFQASSSEHTRTTELKPLHLCKTPSQDDDSYYLEKKLSSNHSSSTRKLPPASLKSCADSYHSQRSTSISISCSRVGAFAEKPTPVLVEIQPGFSLPLRGSEETLQAVEAGRILNTDCLSCCAALVVKDDCDFVICPGCRVVSPVEGGFGTMECVGLGMRF